MRKIFLVASLILFTTGCASTEVVTTASYCEDVSDSVLQKIESGLKNGEVTLHNGQVVKSNDFKSVYFVSANLKNPELDIEDIATFSINQLNNDGMIFSINSIASDFFVWPSGSTTESNIKMSDDGARESQECVNK
ncbi:MAG: hypothetical protein ACKUBY_04920 [Candidatus Moraniibacteriota bacterium]